MPCFVINMCPNINIPIPPLNGKSGPQGVMMFETDVAGTPVAKFPPLSASLTALASIVDGLGASGSASKAVEPFTSGGSTMKLRAS